MAPENLAGPSDFKAFRHCFLCFASRNRLWHKEPGKYALDRTWQGEFRALETQNDQYPFLRRWRPKQIYLVVLKGRPVRMAHASLLRLDKPLAEPLPLLAVPSLKIVHFLEDSSRIPQHLCRAVYADTPLRRHADTVVIFGCGSAALSLCVLA